MAETLVSATRGSRSVDPGVVVWSRDAGWAARGLLLNTGSEAASDERSVGRLLANAPPLGEGKTTSLKGAFLTPNRGYNSFRLPSMFY